MGEVGLRVGILHDTAAEDDPPEPVSGRLELVYIGSPENGFSDAGRSIELLDRGSVVFGRAVGTRCLAVSRTPHVIEIGVPLPWVSSRHCELSLHQAASGRRVDLEDLGSRNGTRVCGQPVARHISLRAGDVLEVGRSFWMLRQVDRPTAGARGAGPDRDAGELPQHVADLPHPLLPERADTLARAARSTVPVLVTGPTGGGKRRLAQWMHAHSGRPGPLVTVDLGALSGDELEDRVVASSRVGAAPVLQQARGGTLCLRGLDVLSARMQAHVRALITEAAHAGGHDVRLIATSTRSLREAVADGSFRRELYARLSGFEVHVPPLRERLDRLGVLMRGFFESGDGPELHVTTEAFRYALAYDWPYNVRQLHQALTTAMTIASRQGWVGQPVLAEALQQHDPGFGELITGHDARTFR